VKATGSADPDKVLAQLKKMKINDVFTTPRDGQHALCLGEGRADRRIDGRSPSEAVLDHLQMDLLLPQRLSQLRGLCAVEASETENDHLSDASQASFEIIDEKILDKLAHGVFGP
jgi:hypothetical protein